MHITRRVAVSSVAFAAALMLPITAVQAASVTPDTIGVTKDKATLAFGTVDTSFDSAAQTVTFTSSGDAAAHFGAASIAGTNADSFKISANTCSGKDVAAAATCTISVVANAQATGALTGHLTITDNTAAGSETVALTATGHVGSLGTFYSLKPSRVLDTRNGTGGHTGPVGPNSSITLQVANHGGVPPTGVSAVVLNVTETAATTGGFVTVSPTGVLRPTASNLNYVAGDTRANAVTVSLGTNGSVDLYNSGTSALIADVSGYFVGSDTIAAGSQYTPVGTNRVLDTRQAGSGGPIPGKGGIVYTGISFGDPSIDSHIKALAVNITAVTPSTGGFFTAWNGKGAAPNASTLNFAKGATTPNMAIVPATACDTLPVTCLNDVENGDQTTAPYFAIQNSASGSVNVIVDVVGIFTDSSVADMIPGGRFHAITPQRIVDSRTPLGVSGPLGANKSVVITPPAALADEWTMALATNDTAYAPTSATYLTFWPYYTDSQDNVRPPASTLNPAAHQTVANAAITELGFGTAKFNAYNSLGTSGLIIDVAGYYEFDPANGPPLGANGIAPLALGGTHLGAHAAAPLR